MNVSSCEPTLAAVCGCDGVVYANECAAYAAGTDLDGHSPDCTPPEGTFSCGHTHCTTGEQFCVERYENGWVCEPLPGACRGSDPDCDCADGAAGAGGDAGEPLLKWDTLTEADHLCGPKLPPTCLDDGPGLKIICSAQ